MKKYCGNGKPFLYGVFCQGDREKALPVLEKLSEAGHEVWYGNGWDAAEQKKLKKAAGAVLFLTPASVADPSFREAAIRAARSGRPLLSVFLADTGLDKALRLELGDIQGLMKYALSEGEFYQKLLSSPALGRLEITPEQKEGARRTLIAGIAGAAAAVVLVAVSLAGLIGGGRIDAGSRLDKLGLSGSVSSIKTVYLYGENLLDHYQLSGGLNRVTEEGVAAGDSDGQMIALAATGEEFPWGKLTDISDFSQLSNLEELCLAGNQVTDISPLKSLKKLRMLDLTGTDLVDITSLPEFPALEVINLSWCGFADNPDNPYDHTMYQRSLDALLGCGTLKTVYVDSAMLQERPEESDLETSALADAYAAGTLPFEVILTDRSASDWAELKAAAEDTDVYFITIVGDIEIPQGETLTIRSGVSLQGAYCNVVNRGTIELYGLWEMGLCSRENYGTLLVKSGGNYNGGMCDTDNYGTFVIEEGGVAVLQRGHQYGLHSGTFQVDGLFLIPNDGGSLTFSGGQFVNNGRIACYLTDGAVYQRADGAAFDPAGLPGTGSFEELGSLPHDHSF